ncbi:MAG TPA: Holliday junction ATP-dependent DNA helicase RuvA [Elusimicrobiales bacterium]|nr:Holliday junction ATP-dependent DNA helicase RuvA [Elusimicrobiales bacterium]
MIAYLRGSVIAKSEGSVILEAGGIGYEVNMAQASLETLPGKGGEAEVYIKESISPYDGTSLYGFNSLEERELFELFKSMPNTGPKKALEYLNKALKSLPDFRKSVLTKDARLLTGIFGFTAKTAEKLISLLREKMQDLKIAGEAKISAEGGPDATTLPELLSALGALGYTATEVRRAVPALQTEGIKPDEPVERLLKRALGALAK